MTDQSAQPLEEATESRVKASRRRDKPQLSCNLCRQKKLKCDRAQPCRNCERRPLGSCVYVHSNKSRTTIDRATHGASQSRSISVQDRIRRLERLVVSLAETPNAIRDDGWSDELAHSNNGKAFSKPLDEADDSYRDVEEPFGRLSVDETETRYVNPSHWEAILEDITEIKDAINSPGSTNSSSRSQQSPEAMEGPWLLFGQKQKVTATEIICSLPSREVVDSLIEIFLRSLGVPPLTVHVPTFEKEYKRFWNDPEAMPITWLALLHTVMALSLQFLVRSRADPIPGIPYPETMARLFTRRAANCLVTADYSKPTQYTVETMVMYLACEHFLNPENEFRASLLFGVTLRLAMRAGFHKDPAHYPQMSVFEGEMRRRIWALINQLDLTFASSLGLPRLIDDRQINTAPPLNVLDEDLDPDMTEPPKPRPDTEQTWVGLMNFKTRMLSVLDEVVDRTNSVRELSYNEVLHLEKKIQSVAATKPAWLELPKDKSFENVPVVSMMRLIGLDLISQRSRMILHRKFVVAATANNGFSYSRHCCLTAATQTLQYQLDLYRLSHSVDRLLSSSWKFFAMMTHDFLLAAMIVCLDLDQTFLRGSEDFDTEEEKQGTMRRYEILQGSYRIWSEIADNSFQAKKGIEILKVMLDKVEFKRAESSTFGPTMDFTIPNYVDGTTSSHGPASSTTESKDEDTPPHIQSFGLETVPGGPLTDNNATDVTMQNQAKNDYMTGDAQVFQNILSSPENFDWLEWDSQFAPSGLNIQP